MEARHTIERGTHEHREPVTRAAGKAKACETSEELYALAKEEGVELSEDDLASISGGMVSGWSIPGCPKFDGHTKVVH